MNTFSLLHPFLTWVPGFRIAMALIIIALAGGFCGFIIKSGLDDISKKETTIKHLEAFSLDLFKKISEAYYGISFSLTTYSNTDPEAIRHLVNLDLIELNAFPSEPTSQIYSFTDLGRYVLEEKLNQKLLLKDFCEMMRIWYWKGYKKEFETKKNDFAIKYKMSWDEAFRIFESIMIKLNPPQQTETDAFAIFLKYTKQQKTYEKINSDLVIPWQEETKKIKNPLRYIF